MAGYEGEGCSINVETRMKSDYGAFLKVLDAGEDSVNGFYKANGTFNDKPQYHKIDLNGNEASPQREIVWDDCICDDSVCNGINGDWECDYPALSSFGWFCGHWNYDIYCGATGGVTVWNYTSSSWIPAVWNHSGVWRVWSDSSYVWSGGRSVGRDCDMKYAGFSDRTGSSSDWGNYNCGVYFHRGESAPKPPTSGWEVYPNEKAPALTIVYL